MGSFDIIYISAKIISSLLFSEIHQDGDKEVIDGYIDISGYEYLQDEAPDKRMLYKSKGYYISLDTVIDKVAKAQNIGVSYMLFVNSWDKVSRAILSKYIQIFSKAELPLDDIFIIGLDKHGKTKTNIHQFVNVKQAPTLIVYRNSKEIGRITHKKVKSVEKNLLNILNKIEY